MMDLVVATGVEAFPLIRHDSISISERIFRFKWLDNL
jgi:hypothetical protein